jgi:hypothetical protein
MEIKGKNSIIVKTVALLCLLAILIWQSAVLAAAEKEPSKESQQIVALDFKLLEKTERYVTDDKADLKEIPKTILALNGKTVKITGYFLIPSQAYYTKKPISNFGVSKNAYGCPCCSWGNQPTIFNTVIVDMKQGDVIEPPFPPLVEVTGIFSVKKEQLTNETGEKRLNALFYINDAQVKKKKQSFLGSIF